MNSIKKNDIKISKTARYFTLGKPSPKIESVWFVFHGYGQLAGQFIEKFTVLDDGKNFVIAPEGLHRFYLKGFFSEVGASWMTKEERLNDIDDYVNYLDQIYWNELQRFDISKVIINFLGFSQGCATACRWLALGNSTAHNLFLIGGSLPLDIDFKTKNTLLNSVSINLAVGRKDQFINKDALKDEEERLRKNKINFNVFLYDGKHDFDDDVILKLKESQNSKKVID